MGILDGLIRGATTGAIGIQQGKANNAALQQKALHDLMLQRLQDAQLKHVTAQTDALTHPAPKQPEYELITGDDGTVQRVAKSGDPGVVQGVKGKTKTEPKPAGPARIDPLGPEGIAAAVRRAKEIAAAQAVGGAGRVTEGERQGSALYQVADDAFGVLQIAEPPTGWSALAGKYGINPALNEKQQVWNQAGMQFADAYLKVTSGKASTEAEVKRNAATITPQFGDKPAVLARKRHTQKVMLDAMKTVAGRASTGNTHAGGASERAQALAKKALGGK